MKGIFKTIASKIQWRKPKIELDPLRPEFGGVLSYKGNRHAFIILPCKCGFHVGLQSNVGDNRIEVMNILKEEVVKIFDREIEREKLSEVDYESNNIEGNDHNKF